MSLIKRDDLPEIYRRHQSGDETLSMIGESYGVTGSAIRSAVKRYEKILQDAEADANTTPQRSAPATPAPATDDPETDTTPAQKLRRPKSSQTGSRQSPSTPDAGTKPAPSKTASRRAASGKKASRPSSGPAQDTHQADADTAGPAGSDQKIGREDPPRDDATLEPTAATPTQTPSQPSPQPDTGKDASGDASTPDTSDGPPRSRTDRQEKSRAQTGGPASKTAAEPPERHPGGRKDDRDGRAQSDSRDHSHSARTATSKPGSTPASGTPSPKRDRRLSGTLKLRAPESTRRETRQTPSAGSASEPASTPAEPGHTSAQTAAASDPAPAATVAPDRTPAAIGNTALDTQKSYEETSLPDIDGVPPEMRERIDQAVQKTLSALAASAHGAPDAGDSLDNAAQELRRIAAALEIQKLKTTRAR